MDKIVLFDIDKTLFDREKYLRDFFKLLKSEFNLTNSEVEDVGKIYQEVKEEYGYFAIEAFLVKIYKKHPNLSEKLEYYFNEENLKNYLYEDSKIIYEIKKSRIGIFSKGDNPFQRAKIKSFEDVIEKDLIYVFHNKIEKIPDILEKHKDSELTIVDDNIAVLINSKELNPSIKTIFIDRENEYDLLNNIDFKLSSLFGIIPILNE